MNVGMCVGHSSMIRYRRTRFFRSRFPPRAPLASPSPPPRLPRRLPLLDLFDTITGRTQNKVYPQNKHQAKRQSFDAQERKIRKKKKDQGN